MTGKTGDGEKKSGQEPLVSKFFHGSEGCGPCVDLFLSGKGAFEMAFVQSDVENNREGNYDRVNGIVMELCSLLHFDLCE